MKKELPIYDITKFQNFNNFNDVYANYLKPHVSKHHFTNLPHKHDFYLVALFTHGSGTHEIEFVSYKVEPGALFIMKPGQMHYWKLSKDVQGYIYFHSKNFYDEAYRSMKINEFSFYKSNQNQACIKLSGNLLEEIRVLMRKITEEYNAEKTLKHQKMHALINLVYVELTRTFYPIEKKKGNGSYLIKVEQFEELIDNNYKVMKSASDYAEKLNMTEKHLNRICKDCYNKTSTQIITARIILEAKRMLIYGKFNVTEIAEQLGYINVSYFVRLFKKNTGVTPRGFLNSYK